MRTKSTNLRTPSHRRPNDRSTVFFFFIWLAKAVSTIYSHLILPQNLLIAAFCTERSTIGPPTNQMLFHGKFDLLEPANAKWKDFLATKWYPPKSGVIGHQKIYPLLHETLDSTTIYQEGCPFLLKPRSQKMYTPVPMHNLPLKLPPFRGNKKGSQPDKPPPKYHPQTNSESRTSPYIPYTPNSWATPKVAFQICQMPLKNPHPCNIDTSRDDQWNPQIIAGA